MIRGDGEMKEELVGLAKSLGVAEDLSFIVFQAILLNIWHVLKFLFFHRFLKFPKRSNRSLWQSDVRL